MKTIAVYHNKGGVGKTTTVVHLASALAKKGLRVLIVDLDSQANTTYATGLVKFVDEDHDDLKERNIYHVLASKSYSITQGIRASTYYNPPISVIPAHIMIMGKEIELVNMPPVIRRLRTKLNEVREFYDFVLIDTPPSLNIYAKIALITADYLIIPSDLKPFANQGLINVREFIEQIDETRSNFELPSLKVLGVLPSKVSTNASYLKHTYPKRRKIIEEVFGFPVLESAIMERSILTKVTENETTVGTLEIPDPLSLFDYPSATGGDGEALLKSIEEFNLLANEVIHLTNE